METIANVIEIVKNPSDEMLEKAVLQNIFMRAYGGVQPTHILELDNGMQIAYSKDIGEAASHCLFGVPSTHAGLPQEKKKGKRKSPEEIFLFIEKINTAEVPSDAYLCATREVQLSRAVYIKLDYYNGTKRCIKGRVKGDAAYNYSLQQKAIRDVEEMAQRNEYAYFLTLTYSPNDFEKNRAKAFALFKEELTKFKKAAKRKYDCEIASVVEVTDKGYPHAHLIMFTNKPLIPDYIKERKSKGIISGNFYKWILKHWKLGFINLKRAKNDKLGRYIAKYMGKGNFNSDPAKDSKSLKLTKNVRKGLMTTFFPCLYGYRAYGTTWRKKKEGGEQVQEFLKDKDAEGQISQASHENRAKAQLAVVARAARRAANLICFSIKEHKRCAGMVTLARKTGLKPLKKGYLSLFKCKEHPAFTDKVLEPIYKPCSGCKFIKFIQANYEEILKSPVEFFMNVILTKREVEEIMDDARIRAAERKAILEIKKNAKGFGSVTYSQKNEIFKKFKALAGLKIPNKEEMKALIIFQYEMANYERYGDEIILTTKEVWDRVQKKEVKA